MKRSPDNQINASFIDISRIKWLAFLLRSSFFRTTRPLASSEATAYYRPAPGRTDGIPERDQRPRDNGYKSVFTNSWLVRQRHRSWIKGLGKNPQNEWTRSLLAVPFVRATQPWPQVLRETMACIHVNRHNGTPRMACLQVFRQNKRKSECVYRHSPIGCPNKNFGFIRHPMWTGSVLGNHSLLCVYDNWAIPDRHIKLTCVMLHYCQ